MNGQRQRELQAALTLAETQQQSATRLRRRNRVIIGAGLVALVLAVLAGLFGVQANQNATLADQNAAQAQAEAQSRATAEAIAVQQREEALRQASIGLAAQAKAELQGTAPERGVLLALEALENYPYTGEAESALAQAVETGLTYIDYESQLPTGSLRWYKGAWSRDGQLFAATTGGPSGDLAIVWKTATGEQAAILQAPDPTNATGCNMIDLAWEPDSKQLITLSGYSQEICSTVQPPTIWDATTGVALRTFGVYTNATSVDWSSTGKSIIIGDEAGNAKIWDAGSGTLRWTLEGHTARVNDVAFSPQSERVATVSADGTTVVWDVATGQAITRLVSLENGITGVSWSPDGLRLATSSEDGLGRIWDSTTGALSISLSGHAGPVNDVAWSRDGEQLATVSADGTFRLWNAELGTEIARVMTTRTGTVSLSDNGEQVATGGSDYESTAFRIWRVLSDSTRILSKDGVFAQVEWSPDGQWIAASSVGAQVWDAHTKQNLRQLEMDSDQGPPFGYFDWSPDSRYMVMANGEDIRIWEPATGARPSDMKVTQEPNFVFATSWSANGTFVAAATNPDYKTVIQDIRSGKVITTVGDGTCFMHAPDWSPQSDRFVTGCLFTADPHDNTPLTVWDANGNKVMELPSANGESVRGEWSPDGTLIAVGYEDGTIKIWDAAAGTEIQRLAASNGIRIYQVTWSPDGKRVASADSNGLIKVWDLAAGEEVMSYQAAGLTTSIDWSTDGKYLSATANQLILIRAWQSTDELIQYAKECCVFRELTAAEREQFGLAVK